MTKAAMGAHPPFEELLMWPFALSRLITPAARGRSPSLSGGRRPNSAQRSVCSAVGRKLVLDRRATIVDALRRLLNKTSRKRGHGPDAGCKKPLDGGMGHEGGEENVASGRASATPEEAVWTSGACYRRRFGPVLQEAHAG